MQERRTIVRTPCLLTASYRLSDGADTSAYLTDLSLRGTGLLSAACMPSGSRIIVHMALPQDEQPLELKGSVRWAEGPSGPLRRYAAGVEFDPLDDTSHFRVSAYLSERARQLRQAGRLPWAQRLKATWESSPAAGARAALGALFIAGLAVAVILLQRHNQQLRQAVADQAWAIEQLESRHEILVTHLHATQEQSAALTAHMIELQDYSRAVEARAGALEDQLQQTQEEYARLADDRDEVRRQLADLQQRQDALQAKFQSLGDLKQAISQAQRLQRRQGWLSRRARMRRQDHVVLAGGNRGYLVQSASTAQLPDVLSIQVYTPEEPVTAALSAGP